MIRFWLWFAILAVLMTLASCAPSISPARSTQGSAPLPSAPTRLAAHVTIVPVASATDVGTPPPSISPSGTPSQGMPASREPLGLPYTRDVKPRINPPVPDDTLLCIVTLSGDFISSAPAGFPPITSTTAVYIFDARNGNLLGTGGGR